MNDLARVPAMVSVIVPTWNRAALLERCLSAVKGQDYGHAFEVVVAVDGSVDDTASTLALGIREDFSILSTVTIPHAGMVAARIAGVQASSGDLVVFLDDDAVPEPGWLSALVAAAAQPGVGMAGGRVKGSPYDVVARVHDNGHLEWSGFDAGGDQPVEVDFVPGGNMAIWRPVLDEIGGFDPRFTKTAWREETDVCVRAARAGYSIVYEPRAAIAHEAARWRGRSHVYPSTVFSLAKNNAYFVAKHFSSPRNLVYWSLIDPWIEPAKRLAGGFVVLALAPVRVVGAIVGWIEGRRQA